MVSHRIAYLIESSGNPLWYWGSEVFVCRSRKHRKSRRQLLSSKEHSFHFCSISSRPYHLQSICQEMKDIKENKVKLYIPWKKLLVAINPVWLKLGYWKSLANEGCPLAPAEYLFLEKLYQMVCFSLNPYYTNLVCSTGNGTVLFQVRLRNQKFWYLEPSGPWILVCLSRKLGAPY